MDRFIIGIWVVYLWLDVNKAALFQYAPCLKPKAIEQVVERLPVVVRFIAIADTGRSRR